MNKPNVVSHRIVGADAVFSLNGIDSFVVDAADAPMLSGWRVRLHRVSHLTYVMLSRSVDGAREQVLLHRHLVPGAGLRDHRDGDGANNRRSNIRVATGAQNNANAPRKKTVAPALPRGVTRRKDGLLRARIKVDGREVLLGYFHDEDAAGDAYAQAAKRVHGEFDYLQRVPA